MIPKFNLNSITESSKELYGKVIKKAVDVSDTIRNPSQLRREASGLLKGAMPSIPGVDGAVNFVQSIPGMFGGMSVPGMGGNQLAFPTNQPGSADWRIKVSLPVGAELLYQDTSNSLLQPLVATNGVVFPYTPNITVSHKANYQSTRLTHSNYAAYSYEGSEVDAINIDGEFTVQNITEGQYLIAAIYFFRAASKMFFGAQESVNRGNPPPILLLDGYGAPYFPAIKCVLTSFSHTMPADVDYMPIPVEDSEVRLPTTSKITISLQPVYSRKSLHRDFSIDEFAKGKLLDKGFI